MHGHDHFGARRDRSSQQRRIKRSSGRFDIHIARRSANIVRGVGGVRTGIGDRQHFVARTHAQRPQTEQQRIGTVGEADTMICTAKIGPFLLKGGDFGAKHVPTAANDAGGGFV